MKPHERIIVAADVDSAFAALRLWEELRGHVGGIKIGLQLGLSMLYGPLREERIERAVRSLKAGRRLLTEARGNIMTDFKLHDIPNTVAGAAQQITDGGESLAFTVHASGGEQALREAVSKVGSSKVLAVTVLTSLDTEECQSIFGDEPREKVIQFAKMAGKAGVRGIVCSPLEAHFVRKAGLEPWTPGVRLETDSKDDQARVLTPGAAIANGAERVIVGRTITKAKDKVAAAKAVAADIKVALDIVAESNARKAANESSDDETRV